MFVFEGKTSLRTIFSRYANAVENAFVDMFIDTTTTFRRYEHVLIAANEIACAKCWKFLEFHPETFVLTPSGQLVGLEQFSWVSPNELYQPCNGLVNLKSGLLQASEVHFPYRASATCAETLSPFEGCPVYISDDDDDDLLFEDMDFYRIAAGQQKSNLVNELTKNLDDWFEDRSSELSISKQPFVESVFIDGPDESPDLEDEGPFGLLLDQKLVPMLVKAGAEPTSNQVIVETTKQAFPNGKQSSTWDEVEAKVGYSRRSIVRAMKAENQYLSWA